MDTSPTGSIAGFSDVCAWFGAQSLPGATVETAGPSSGQILVRSRRFVVAVVDAGGVVPTGFDVLLVVGAPTRLADALQRLDTTRVHLLATPCAPEALARAVDEAVAAAKLLSQAKLADHLLEIGLALNTAHDPERVLDLILQHARSITNADAGSIYLVEDERTLRFKIAQNDSVVADFSEFSLPVTESSVVGACVLSEQVVSIPDLYVEGGPMALGRRFTHDRSFDERFGYQTRSMITTPMRPPGGSVLGVIQLINAKVGEQPLSEPVDFEQRVIAFSPEDERLCSALAAQGAVALENARLYAEIQTLFEGFVRASVHAIEQRDPTTSGHSQRVADLTVDLAKAADRSDQGRFASLRFSPEQLQEIEYAGLLHDFGKVGVREEVLVKAKKLYPQKLALVQARFDHMRTALQVELLTAQLQRLRAGKPEDPNLEREAKRRADALEQMRGVVLGCNEPTVVTEEVSAKLQHVARTQFRDSLGTQVQLLDDDDVQALLVRRGSLTQHERLEIQNHVTHTYNFLVRIPWGPSLRLVPEIAGKHHEYVNGSGYPHQVSGPAIPVQARMMTVADIFDALTASDRPYKKAVPVPRALDILRAEQKAGKLDGEILDLFIEAKVYASGHRAR